MNEMVERVAKAVFDEANRQQPHPSDKEWAQASVQDKGAAHSFARAAIAAMREPTEAMAVAGAKTVEGHVWLTGESIHRRWQAMIDAALAEGPMTEPSEPADSTVK